MYYEEKIYKVLNEAIDRVKPSFIKKAQAIMQKELGGNIEVEDGDTLRLSGKNNGLRIEYSKHPIYGDTFEIYVVKKDGFPTGSQAAYAGASSTKDALKAVMMLSKYQKKLLLK